MKNREDWIRKRAYEISEYNKRNGFLRSDIDNWLDAESEWKRGHEHSKEFHKRFDIR